MPGWLDVWRSFWSRSGHERARLLRSAWHAFRQHGAAPTANRMRRSARLAADRDAENARYAQWCRAHTPDPRALEAMKAASARFAYQPLVSIITPVYNTDPRWLHACGASVVAQAWPRWEWHVANDGSDDPRTLETLAELAAIDARITVHDLPENGGISAASNVALRAAAGDYVALLDHDDALPPHALLRVVERLNQVEIRPDVLYTDEDKLEPDGSRSDAYFKPDWSPELFLSNMYVCHLLVARRALVVEAGGFRSAFDFSQDYDLVLRLMERANRIDHLPDVLYHWRKVPRSTATAGGAKPTAHLAGRRALQDYLDRNGVEGSVADAEPPGFYRIVYALHTSPAVSVIGPFNAHDQARLRAGTSWSSLEFAASAAEATGQLLLLLNPAFEPQSPDWLEALVQVLRPGVGAVGGKLLRADGTVEHIGLVLGLDGVAGRPFVNAPADHPGYFGNARLIRTVSAVTGDCLLTARDTFTRAGGLDGSLGREAAAIDYCLRVSERSERVVFTPWSLLRRRVPAPVPHVGGDDERRLRARWGDALARDPCYSPHLSTHVLDYRVDA
ncbi:MAG: glycosyltransferase [Acidobacteria bacterium]|nr:glycosyltransferase [Acidobacteriota bacterium]